VVLLAVVLSGALPADASTIITAGSVSAGSPPSADTLDVTLTNTGPSAISVGGFAFEIKVIDSHITFASATTATVAAPYIFDGMSLLGPTISTTAGGQTLDASDQFAVIGSGTTIGSGATVGPGHVFSNVSAGDSPGPVTVTLSAFPATSLTDFAGANVNIDTLTNGSITITAPVPEPATLALVLLGLPALAMIRHRRR
jgi:PEP-CTERM motif-containing protein